MAARISLIEFSIASSFWQGCFKDLMLHVLLGLVELFLNIFNHCHHYGWSKDIKQTCLHERSLCKFLIKTYLNYMLTLALPFILIQFQNLITFLLDTFCHEKKSDAKIIFILSFIVYSPDSTTSMLLWN